MNHDPKATVKPTDTTSHNLDQAREVYYDYMTSECYRDNDYINAYETLTTEEMMVRRGIDTAKLTDIISNTVSKFAMSVFHKIKITVSHSVTKYLSKLQGSIATHSASIAKTLVKITNKEEEIKLIPSKFNQKLPREELEKYAQFIRDINPSFEKDAEESHPLYYKDNKIEFKPTKVIYIGLRKMLVVNNNKAKAVDVLQADVKEPTYTKDASLDDIGIKVKDVMGYLDPAKMEKLIKNMAEGTAKASKDIEKRIDSAKDETTKKAIEVELVILYDIHSAYLQRLENKIYSADSIINLLRHVK